MQPSGSINASRLDTMILQLEMGGKITITATEVIEQEVKDNELEIPSGGKKVTAAEFKEIQDKKFKEMGVEKGKPKVIFHSSTEMQ
jgi:hypothetical protein